MKILVVDDDPLTAEGIAGHLQNEGFRTKIASGGTRALDLVRSWKPDLVCLDIMMPGMNGYDVCRGIRKSQPDLPIVFISAKNEEMDVVIGLELGADEFIRKPFGKGELLARIRAVLRRSAQGASDRCLLKMHDLAVYPDELRALRGSTEIPLGPREASMLSLLFQNAGRPVTREQFLDHCWGMDYFPDSRTLDQHIANLRKKIEHDPAHPLIIETVRGLGYRFRGEREKSV